MWQGFTIALREGIEAFLIVALTLSYLRRTGRQHLASAVVWGIGASLLVCVGAGALLARAANHSLWEGILAAVAAVLVASLLIYVLRSARTMKAKMERRIERLSSRSSGSGFWGVFLFTVLMITREGMEAALLLATAIFQLRSAPLFIGLGLGLCAAAAIAVTWKHLGHRVNLGVLLNVSALFLGALIVQLILYAVHELAEAGVVPAAQAIHDATEILGPDGAVGRGLTYLLAAVPLTWLAVAWLRVRGRSAFPPKTPARVQPEPEDPASRAA
jgi:high-affinity iron transporter